MEPISKIWEVEIDGNIEWVDLDTLKDWIETGKVDASTKARRESLRWIELSEVKILSQYFQAQSNNFEPREPKKNPIDQNQARQKSSKQNLKLPIQNSSLRKFSTNYSKTNFIPTSKSIEKTSSKIHLLIMVLVAAVLSTGWVFYVNSKEWNPKKYALTSPAENTSLTMPEDYVEPSAIAKYKANEKLLNADGIITKYARKPPIPCSTKTVTDTNYPGPGGIVTGFHQEMDEDCLREKAKESAKLQADSDVYREELQLRKTDLQKEIKIESAKLFAKTFILLFLVFLGLHFVTGLFQNRPQFS